MFKVTAPGLSRRGREIDSEFSGDSCRSTAEAQSKGVRGRKITQGRRGGRGILGEGRSRTLLSKGGDEELD